MHASTLTTPLLLLGLSTSIGCGGATPANETASESTDSSEDGTSGDEVLDDGTQVIIEDDDPRVSTSAGEANGVVVMWPRIMGFAGEEAAVLQRRMVEIARRVYGGAPVDVRPDPERVCPRGGCRGVSVSALLVVQDGSCLTVAIIGRPEEGDLTLVPWTGTMTLDRRSIGFRDPPESEVTVRGRRACTDLAADLAAHQGEIETALRAARR